MHFCCYNGVALEFDNCRVNRYSVDGRIVVDTKTSHRLEAGNAFTVIPFKLDDDDKLRRRRINCGNSEDEEETVDLVPTDRLELDPLTDEQRLIATASVRGFSFTEKRWLDFFTDSVLAIDWNPNCSHQLVLPEAQKDLVQALVTAHTHQKESGGFDDIVKGKGRGLIFVLHGPPGKFKRNATDWNPPHTDIPLRCRQNPNRRNRS